MNDRTMTVTAVEPPVKRRKKISKDRILHYVMLGVFIFFVLFPFYVLFATSIMNKYESNQTNFRFWPKDGVWWDSYKEVLFESYGGYSVLNGFKNTLLYYVPSSMIGIFSAAMAAFAFAKMKFRLKGPMFALLMSTMMIPNNMSLLISFSLYDTIGWIGTPLPLMVPRMFGTIGVVFFLRQYYMGIPEDLMGCAKIDGLGFFGIFIKIMLPISVPVLVSQFILYFIAGYNDYLGPLLYLPYSDMATLQLVLAQYEDPRIQNWPLRMAGCIVAMAPLIVLYLLSQKFILKDLAVGSGFKG